MSPMRITPIVPQATAADDTAQIKDRAKDPAKIRDAAQQFESLLLGQILRSVRESGGGWLGSGSDSSSDCATEFAEQHFAAMLAQQGGLGLADLIAEGLRRER
jgi:Rod binding domain-containing protein